MMAGQIDVIIKLGGSIITRKDILETERRDSLEEAARLVRECQNRGLKVIIVHGAGSFGHHHAKDYKITSGFLNMDKDTSNRVKLGFCLTRQSVLKLHALVMEALLSCGIPAVGLSPCPTWRMNHGEVIEHNIPTIQEFVDTGFVPVLHGDACLDPHTGCSILSGDLIIKELCANVDVKKVLFLSDVDGIFDKPPDQPGACLLPEIDVEGDGTISTSLSISDGSYDITGGMTLKLRTAAQILVKSGGKIPVFICRLGSAEASRICLSGDASFQREGTLVRLKT